MKLKLTLGIICLFMLSVQLMAQRTVTNKDYRGRVTEQYQINANGDYHGTYTKYFSNGVIEELSVYNKGKITSCKTYEYIGKIRYLMGDRTWDSKGELLTSKIRTHDPYTNKVSAVIETAGLLRNGRWRGWPGHETYIEIYNGNDTIYEWQDRSKSKFRGKFLNGERVKTIKEIHLLNEIAIRDSIRSIEYYAFELTNVPMHKAKDINYYIDNYTSSLLITHAYKIQNVDSILMHKAMYINNVIDTVYRDALNTYYTLDIDSIYNANTIVYGMSNIYQEVLAMNYGTYTDDWYTPFNTNEVQFYTFLCDYLKTGTDETLRSLIIDALDLHCISDIRTLDIYCDTSANIYIRTGNLSCYVLKSCNYSFDMYSRRLGANTYEPGRTTPYIQTKLFKVLKYCQVNNIAAK